MILYIFFFNYFIHVHVYRPRAGADNPLVTIFLCQQKGLITLPICCKLQTISLKSNFIHIFNDFIHVNSPRERGRQPHGDKILMSTERPYHICPIFASLKKKLLRSLILYIFITILYMYIAPGLGHTTPWGQNFYININLLSLWSFVVIFFPLNDFLTFFLKECIFSHIKAYRSKFDLAKVNPRSSFE